MMHAARGPAVEINEQLNEDTHPFQDIFLVVTKLHEQSHLPAGVAVDSVDLQQEVQKSDTTQKSKLEEACCMQSPPLCSRGCPEARCYWHEEAALRSRASRPPCLQPPPSTQNTDSYLQNKHTALWMSSCV